MFHHAQGLTARINTFAEVLRAEGHSVHSRTCSAQASSGLSTRVLLTSTKSGWSNCESEAWNATVARVDPSPPAISKPGHQRRRRSKQVQRPFHGRTVALRLFPPQAKEIQYPHGPLRRCLRRGDERKTSSVRSLNPTGRRIKRCLHHVDDRTYLVRLFRLGIAGLMTSCPFIVRPAWSGSRHSWPSRKFLIWSGIEVATSALGVSYEVGRNAGVLR